MKFQTAYGDKSGVAIEFPDVTRTKQSFKDECDINNIIKKFHKTGLIDFVNTRQPQYGDYSGFDFQVAMDTVAKANEMFAELPAGVRKRFQNDPVEFVKFVSDANNQDEMIKLGLATRLPVDSATGGGKTDGPTPSAPPKDAGNGSGGSPAA